ncbi:Hypothetical predicted protein [Mytilus galloprovincialis]|uniref:G-protein coupled receptors family 1 profile domain-containing protein n=1 Tax=Mytilus galloprovincialis TaxID=29158 RepID=A0A8B6C2U7_MYTGA|nr:Hypothetical predicted protein [Mytilus galloprovincialis]
MWFKVHGSGKGLGSDPIVGDSTVFVKDLCPECLAGSVDLAENGEWQMGSRNTSSSMSSRQHKIGIQIPGKIPVTGLSVWQPKSHRWAAMHHSSDGFWLMGPGLFEKPVHPSAHTPLKMKLTGANGVVIEDQITQMGILRQWILNTFDFDIRATSSAACKIHIWILYSSMDYSAWILIAVTIERVLLLWFPNKMQCVCTKKVAMLVLISIASFLLLVNSHILYGYELSTGKTANHCHYVSKSYLQFWISSWPSIDLVIFCIIPGSFLVVGNILIFVKVLISRRAINRQVSTYSTSSQQRGDSKFSSMTAMLIAVNCVFLVCNIPSRAFMIENTSWSFDTCGHNYAKMSLLWCIFNLLMYVNNSVNFLLYIISGSRFRNEIKEIFKRRKQNHIAAALIPNRPLAIKIRNSSDIYTITQNVSSGKMLDSKC